MGFIELLLIAVGLSMDAFAVSICKGLNMQKINYKHALAIAVSFGGFQGLMPLVGWILGKQFESYITSFDHWVAFILLILIGGKMVRDAFKKDEGEGKCCGKFDVKELILLAVATSIDALAVGITFAFLKVNIWTSVALIVVITFALSFVGVTIGHRFGSKYKSKAELAGGVILILIGTKILIEHLGII